MIPLLVGTDDLLLSTRTAIFVTVLHHYYISYSNPFVAHINVSSAHIYIISIGLEQNVVRARACWGLDLRVKPSPSEMLPNLFAGPQRNGAKRTRKYRMNAERRKLEDHDLRSEGYHLPKAEGNG